MGAASTMTAQEDLMPQCARDGALKLMLEHMDQGLIIIDQDARLRGERSRTFRQWFHDPPDGESLASILTRADRDVGAWFAMTWEEIKEGWLPLELLIDQLPRHLRIRQSAYELAYQPLLAQERLCGMLVTITDITQRVERERLEITQREFLKICERLMHDRAQVEQFVQETQGRMNRIVSGDLADTQDLARELHTLKGNLGLYGQDSLAAMCHTLEDLLAEGLEWAMLDISELALAWEELAGRLRRLLGEPSDQIEIDRQEYEHMLKLIQQQAAHETLLETLRGWRAEPTHKHFARLAEQAQALARRLGRGELRVIIEDHGVRLDPGRLSNFWSAFVHALRNAIDHGVEPPQERLARGKPPGATLWLRSYYRDNKVWIELEEDGRGISWERLRERAQALGLPSKRTEHLIDALFTDGVSTRDQVTQVSGRGVGMGALKQVCLSLGGQIKVWSEPDQGTRFSFGFPLPFSARSAPS